MNTNIDYKGEENRKYPRIIYSSIEKPRLKTGKYKFEVLDVSQRGLKFLNDQEAVFPDYISGKVSFLCGESLDIGGSLIWEQDDDFGLYLKTL